MVNNYRVSTGDIALQNFSGRDDIKYLYFKLINKDPSPKNILYLYGDGGNGKSLIIKFLRKYGSRRIYENPYWEQEGEVVDYELLTDFEEIPTSFIDFSNKVNENYNPFDPVSSLLKMRRDLSFKGLKFPLFDYACLWYFYKSGRSKSQIKNLFPPEELDVISNIADMIWDNKWFAMSKSIISLFDKHFQEKALLFFKKRNIKEEELEEISNLDYETDLLDNLPIYFANDLNQSIEIIGKHKRVTLFFDTHESLWNNDRDISENLYFEKDKWLRQLLCTIQNNKAIVAVIAGREKPRWCDAFDYQIKNEDIHLYNVTHFTKRDAENYLMKLEIDDSIQIKKILEYTSINENEYHPLYLALFVETIKLANLKGEEFQFDTIKLNKNIEFKQKELIERFLKYVDPEIKMAVQALSALNSFDKDMYYFISEQLFKQYKIKFQVSDRYFETLTKFSFVWSDPDIEGNFKIHDLIRKLLFINGNVVVLNTHKILFDMHQNNLKNLSDSNIKSFHLNTFRDAFNHGSKVEESTIFGDWFLETLDIIEIKKNYNYLLPIATDFYQYSKIDPLHKMKICKRLGWYYDNLSKFQNSLTFYEEAYLLNSSLNGKNSPTAVDILIAIFRIKINRGMNISSLLKDLSEICNQNPSNNIIRMKYLKVLVEYYNENYFLKNHEINRIKTFIFNKKESYGNVIEKVRLASKLPKEIGLKFCILLNNIGNVYLQGQSRRSIKIAEEIFLALYEMRLELTNHNHDHLDVVQTKKTIADILFINDDYEKALTLYEQSLKSLSQTYGEKHSDSVSIKISIGELYLSTNSDKIDELIEDLKDLFKDPLTSYPPFLEVLYLELLGKYELSKNGYTKDLLITAEKKLKYRIQAYGKDNYKLLKNYNEVYTIKSKLGLNISIEGEQMCKILITNFKRPEFMSYLKETLSTQQFQIVKRTIKNDIKPDVNYLSSLLSFSKDKNINVRNKNRKK